jgi:hypothetical protein
MNVPVLHKKNLGKENSKNKGEFPPPQIVPDTTTTAYSVPLTPKIEVLLTAS